MNGLLKYLFGIAAASLLLAGCCTAHNSGTWEYKVTNQPFLGRGHIEKEQSFLNDLGKDGWILVEKDADGAFIFKRPKNWNATR